MISVQQTGAQSPKVAPGNHIPGWEFLPSLESSKVLSTAETFDDLFVDASPLAVLETHALAEHMANILGLSYNPFLGVNARGLMADKRVALSEPTPTIPEVEQLLHGCMSLHPAIACITLLESSKATVLNEARKFCVMHMEVHQEDILIWRKWARLNPTTLSEEERKAAKEAATKFVEAAGRLFTDLVLVIKGAASNQNELDIEQLLKTWRKYTPMGLEQQLEKERLLYKKIETIAALSWPVRRDHLIKLVKRTLPKTTFEVRAVEINESNCYEDFCAHVGYMNRFKEYAEFPEQKEVKMEHSVKRDVKSEHPVKRYEGGNQFGFRSREGKFDHPWTRPGTTDVKVPDRNSTPTNVPPTFPVGPKDDPIPSQGAIKAVPRRPLDTNTSQAPRDDTPRNITTRSGRTSKPPVTFEPQSSEKKNCRNTAAISTEIRQINYPVVGVKTSVSDDTYVGHLDTCSDLNYISRSASSRLDKTSAEPPFEKQFTLETMTGIVTSETLPCRRLTITLKDNNESWTKFSDAVFIIHSGDIPGGADFLLQKDWVLQERLHQTGTAEGINVSLPNSTETMVCDAATMCDTNQCLATSIPIDDECDDMDVDIPTDTLFDIISDWPRHAVQIGPLKIHELEEIKSRVFDPSATLTFLEGKEHPPVKLEGYPTTAVRLEAMNKELDNLVEAGILERCPKGSGLFTAPCFTRLKKNGSVRIVANFTELNDRLSVPTGVKIHSPVEWAQRLPSFGKHYAILDVRDAFYRVRVHPDHQKYLHVRVWGETRFEYRYKRLPQGLKISPSWWIALIESTISSLEIFLRENRDESMSTLLEGCQIICYADDILIAGNDPIQVEQLESIVYQVLAFMEMYVPENKRQRGSSVICLGTQLSDGKLGVSPETLEKIKQLKIPKTKEQLRSVLGTLNYVRWNISQEDLEPLKQLMTGRAKFQWGPDQAAAWDKCVTQFRNIPINCFSWSPGVESTQEHRLVIQTDASDHSIGWVIYLIPTAADTPDFIDVAKCEDFKIISIGSRRLTDAERRYVTHDREGLAIFTALHRHHRLILLMGHCYIQSDNRTALSQMRKTNIDNVEIGCSMRSRRWVRWWCDLADILPLVKFQHIPGESNTFADYLSRYTNIRDDMAQAGTQTEDVELQVDDSLQCLATHAGSENFHSEFPDSNAFNVIANHLARWTSDTTSEYLYCKLADIVRSLSNDIDDTWTARYKNQLENLHKRFHLDELGQLVYINRGTSAICVPNVTMGSDGPSIRTHLVHYYHELSPLSCHRGEVATMAALRRTWWWPNMDRSVSEWTGSCAPCITTKGVLKSKDYNGRNVNYPNELVLVDWAGPLPATPEGHRYVLVMVDGFSGYTLLYPSIDKTSEAVATGLLNWVSILGTPLYWASDNDSTFNSAVTKSLRQMLLIHDVVVPAYSPTSQGQVERVVRLVKDGINTITMNIDIPWTTLLRAIQWQCNSSPRFGNDISPFLIMLGREPLDPLAARFALDDATPDYEISGEPSADAQSYLTALRTKLDELRTYWYSRIGEERNKGIDNLLLKSKPQLGPVFSPGDTCARVTHINGRRQILEEMVTVIQSVGNNTFEVKDREGKIILSHGYQLIKIPNHDERSLFKDTRHQPTPPRVSPEVAHQLRNAEVGTFLLAAYEGSLHLGTLVSPYISGEFCDVLYFRPVGNNCFRRPSATAEEQWLWRTPVSAVETLEVSAEETGRGVFKVRWT